MHMLYLILHVRQTCKQANKSAHIDTQIESGI